MPAIAADFFYNEFYNEYNELMLREQKCLPYIYPKSTNSYRVT